MSCFGRFCLNSVVPWQGHNFSRCKSSLKMKLSKGKVPGKSPMGSFLAQVHRKELWLIQKTYTRARSISDIPKHDPVHLLAQQMKEYMQEYRENGAEPFFHRKSGRVVLSVLHIEHEGQARFVKGINSEVSLPTGSVCAERSAISNARASFPNICRKQMKGIAVLEVPLVLNNWESESVQQNLLNPLPPCGACNEWLMKIGEESHGFYVVTFQDLSLELVQERFLFWSQQESVTAPPDLGPWTCNNCKTSNLPLTVKCQNCGANRFSAAYLHISKPTFKILEALDSAPLRAQDLMTELKLDDLHLVRRRLNKLKSLRKRNPHGMHPVIMLGSDGRYHLTETGRRALHTRRKLLKTGQTKHKKSE